MYWIRKRDPEALRAIIGKQEEKRSLRTRDPSEAKLRLLRALSELETKWKNLQAGPQTLSEQEAHTLARPVYDEWIRRYRANPSEQRLWYTEIVGVAGVLELPPAIPEAHLLAAYDRASSLQRWCFDIADQVLTKAGLTVDERSRIKLAKAVSAAVQRASLTLERRLKSVRHKRPCMNGVAFFGS